MRTRVRPPRPGVVDAAVAAALVLAAQLEVWADGPGSPTFAAVALAGTAPVALRRRFPLGVLLVVMGSVAALTALGSAWFSVAQLLAMLLVSYSVAVHGPALRAWAGLAVALGVGVANSLATAERPEIGDVVFPLVLLAGPWSAGRALRLWHRRTAELQHLTDELQHEREERAALAVAAERARIARELHDVLTQAVQVIVLHAEGAEEALDRDPSLVRRPLRAIQETGREALRETRRMVGGLQAPDDLRSPPSTHDLPALVDLVRSTGLDVRLTVEGRVRPLPPLVELSVYRIVQQALTNTLAHAEAGRADVVVRFEADGLSVRVADDGVGGMPTDVGSGLAGMRERATVLGGSLTAGPGPTGGFVVTAQLPVDPVPA